MESKDYKGIIKKIKVKDYSLIYVLQGDEAFFIDRIIEVIEREILSESEKAFNLSVLYGRDIDAKQVLDHARQFPMMAEKRVVIVKEAQAMKDIKGLESYFTNPSPHTVLAMAYKKKIDGRIKWVKEAKKSDTVSYFTSEVVPEYKLSRWIDQYIKDEGYSAMPEAIEMMAQYLGNDLKKVINEFQKIKLNLEGKQITVKDVEKNIGISRDYDIYALLKAMSRGDIARVQLITDNLENNDKEQPLPKILPGIASYFERVLIVAQHFKKDDRSLASMIGTYPSFVREYRDMARLFGINGLVKSYHLIVEADGMAKGLNRRNHSGILKELIGKMLLLTRSYSNVLQ